MRQDFAAILYNMMTKDKDIFFLTGDLGMYVLDKLKADFPDRFINCGASEQAMTDVAVGLIHSGKKAICYSISPFIIYRPFETLRTYFNHEKLPVLLVGSGRDTDYQHDGYSHDASDISQTLKTLTNFNQYYPNDKTQLNRSITKWYTGNQPCFLSLKK